MEFLHPSWLWLWVAVPAIWFLPRRITDVRHALLRSAVLVLLVLGMAQPVRIGQDAAPHVVFIVDGDASHLAAAATLRDTVPDASTMAIVPEPLAAEVATGYDLALALPTSGTRAYLDRALAIAARSIPDGAPGAVLVVATGQSQSRAWAEATQDLTARGIPVHAIQTEPHELDRMAARIVDVVPLDVLRVGRPARLRVDVINSTQSVPIEMRAGGEVLAKGIVPAGTGRRSVTLSYEPKVPGFLPATFSVVRRGTDAQMGGHTVVLPVQDPIRALYLGQRVVEGRQEMAALVGSGVKLETRAVAGADPRAVLDGVDLVVLDDRPADSIPPAFHQALAEAVQNDGLGLLVSGGRAAFGAGGWHKSPIATQLPVEFLHREEKRDPSTTLVVIIDTSGSMGGGRVQLAKEVARLAIRRLLPHDKIGLVEFYGAKRWAAPIQPASNRIEIERALNRLNAGGGTVILPAIEEAFYGMQNVETRYKHVLVLTDGGVERGSFEPLLRKMASKGINVSTVLVGAQSHSEFLVDIANWGKGRFYGVPNRFNLPEVILKQPASARLPAYRPGTYDLTAHGGPRWWGEDGAPERIPPLLGYVETRARPGAETLLEVTQGKRPLISTWRYGAGRVTTFMSEPVGPGTHAWSEWDGYGAFLGRLLARTSSSDRAPYGFHLRRVGAAWQLVATRRGAGTDAPLAWTVDTSGARTPLAFRQRSGRVFTAQVTSGLRFEAGADDGGRSPIVRLALDPADQPDAVLVDPERALDLQALAQATGGVAVPWAERSGLRLTTGGGARALSVTRVWPWLLLLALLFYLQDVFHRRRRRSLPEAR